MKKITRNLAAMAAFLSASLFTQAEMTWFGPIQGADSGFPANEWAFHEDHGWLYFAETPANTTWFYDERIDELGTTFSGWAYSDAESFPFIYLDAGDGLWVLFVQGTSTSDGTPRVFVETNNYTTVALQMGSFPNDIVEIAAGTEGFSSLVAALTRADLVGALQGDGPFTVFAPTDDAFAQLDPALLNSLLTDDNLLPTLTNILLYHVVPGKLTAADLSFDPASIFNARESKFYLTSLAGADIEFDVTPLGVIIDDSAFVTLADIEANNGIIHVINQVILPPANIVGVAQEAGIFESLVAAAIQADLAGVLSDGGPFTVFAPTDDAFAALGSATIDSLFLEENKAQLAAILTYHVVPGKVYANQVAPGTSAETVNGASVSFSASENGLMVNDANITATDIRALNGVIHVIDKVILPPQPEATLLAIGFDAGAFNYTINGETAPVITMQRGQTYTFERTGFGGHPFTIATVAPGTAWSEDSRYGDSPSLTTEGATITYTPTASTPDTLYYRCTVHDTMGNTILVTD